MDVLFEGVMLPGKSWNPVTGCTKYSEGCANCYAERIALRLKKDGFFKYRNGFRVTLHPQELKKPLEWKTPRTVFVCSMGDLFHKDVPDDFLVRVFEIMNRAYWHQFRILTKRVERLLEFSNKITWTRNIWVGVSVENEKYIWRIERLKRISAFVRYVNFSPLLGEISYVDLSGIDWVIVGGESGPNFRPAKIEWIRKIRDMCKLQNVPFYFSQWGGKDRKKSGNILDGKRYLELPVDKLFAF